MGKKTNGTLRVNITPATKLRETRIQKLWACYYIIPGQWTPQFWHIWDKFLQTKPIEIKLIRPLYNSYEYGSYELKDTVKRDLQPLMRECRKERERIILLVTFRCLLCSL